METETSDYDVIVFCGGKCGGTTLAKTFTKNDYKTLHMHGINCMGMFNPKIKLTTDIYSLIDSCSCYKKVYIIDCYRNPIERKISAFFQQLHKYFEQYKEKPLPELFQLFNEKYLFDEDYHPMNTMLRHYDISLPNTFDFEKEYNIVEQENKVFIKLRFSSIDSWPLILSNLFEKEITIYPENITSNKKSASLFKEFKKYYKPPAFYLDQHVANNIEFMVYNTQEEQAEYLLLWKNENKTLIGKDGYLFLQNDSCRELKIHCDNLCIVNDVSLNQYQPYKNKYFITIFPNKSMICNDFLPNGLIAQYRPGFTIYKDIFGDALLDGLDVLKELENTYYKTDSHINLFGAYTIYCNFVDKINQHFQLSIEKKNIKIQKKTVAHLHKLCLGIGDLLWPMNLGNQLPISTEDTYYYSDDIEDIYLNYVISNSDNALRFFVLENKVLLDQTDTFIGDKLTWPIVSKHIIYKRNRAQGTAKGKCLIFNDSFLLSTLSLYLELFEEVYISKSAFCIPLIEAIQPDYIFEFRVERFLI